MAAPSSSGLPTFLTAREVKRRVEERLAMAVQIAERIKAAPASVPALLAYVHERETGRPAASQADIEEAALYLRHSLEEWATVRDLLPQAKLIQFSGEQAQLLLEAGQDYADTLDYRLPFVTTMICFTTPVAMKLATQTVQVVALILHTDQTTRGELRALGAKITTEIQIKENDLPDFIRSDGPDDEVVYVHSAATIFWVDGDPDLRLATLSWRSGQMEQFLADANPDFAAHVNQTRTLAVACIGYINAENVTLDRVAGSDLAASRKRAKRGKRPIEDYYICKIRGVRYDSQGREVQPTGRHVSIRFDVRGHFRKLPSGKVTWVRPHQRGLQNELYKPKVYAVDARPDLSSNAKDPDSSAS